MTEEKFEKIVEIKYDEICLGMSGMFFLGLFFGKVFDLIPSLIMMGLIIIFSIVLGIERKVYWRKLK